MEKWRRGTARSGVRRGRRRRVGVEKNYTEEEESAAGGGVESGIVENGLDEFISFLEDLNNG